MTSVQNKPVNPIAHLSRADTETNGPEPDAIRETPLTHPRAPRDALPLVHPRAVSGLHPGGARAH